MILSGKAVEPFNRNTLHRNALLSGELSETCGKVSVDILFNQDFVNGTPCFDCLYNGMYTEYVVVVVHVSYYVLILFEEERGRWRELFHPLPIRLS